MPASESQRAKKAALLIYNPQSGKKQGAELVNKAQQILSAYFSSIKAINYYEQEKWQTEITGNHYETVIAAGGDGTINDIAIYLTGQDISLGVLPIGTFNHFAKHTGLPLDFEQACRVIGRGKTELIDTGLVNNRIFLNFAILGIYTRIIREKQEKRTKGQNKWLAVFIAALRAFIKNPAYQLELRYGSKSVNKLVSLLIISNNIEYFKGLFGLNRRRTSSALQIGVVEWLPRYRLIGLLFKSFFGRAFYANYTKSVKGINLQKITVNGKGRALVGIDGEAVKMRFPLHITIKPRNLKIIRR